MEGTVKWFNNEKGYGFIVIDEIDDVFVHYSQIKNKGYKTLNQGDLVIFELIQAEKGFQAKDVRKKDIENVLQMC